MVDQCYSICWDADVLSLSMMVPWSTEKLYFGVEVCLIFSMSRVHVLHACLRFSLPVYFNFGQHAGMSTSSSIGISKIWIKSKISPKMVSLAATIST